LKTGGEGQSGLRLFTSHGKDKAKAGIMRSAETVTFGGSALDRAAELRNQPERIAALLLDVNTRMIPLWRGRPLIAGEARDTLAMLAPRHALLAAIAAPPPVFLGLENGEARFAVDLSSFEPDIQDAGAAVPFIDQSEFGHPSLPDDHRFADLRAVMARLSPRHAELAATAKAIQGWHVSHGFCARCGSRSDQVLAGWQRSCPPCGAQHFPRTDPVVIMLITRGNSLLIGRNAAWPQGMYSLLAGFIEPGETVEAAVRREVMEESGIAVGPVSYLASQPWPFPASLMLGCRGEATSEQITVDPTELEEALWISREDMLKVMAGEHPGIKPSRRGAIAHFLIANWLADTLG